MNYAQPKTLNGYNNLAFGFFPTILPASKATIHVVEGSQVKEKNPKHDERSIELQYAELLAGNPQYAAREGIIYKWSGSYWKTIAPNQAEKEAFRWLSRSHPSAANGQKAVACVRAALNLLDDLPARNDRRAIIGLRNAYLEIMSDGSAVRIAPDPMHGLTSVLACDLPVSGEGSAYLPKPVPEKSMLWHFLSTSLPDTQVRDYLQELAGDTLFPNVRFQVAALLKGKGRNGKSIYTRLLAALHTNVAHMRLDKLSGFTLLPLLGASLAVVDEVPKAGIDEQTFKTLVSGETVAVDIKFQNPVAAPMTAKWVICTNNDQKSSDNSDGFWRRLAIIPFDTQIAEDDVIPELDRKIIDNELVLFLDWSLIGLQRLMQRGKLPKAPQVVADAKRAAVIASNSVVAWIDEVGVRISTDFITKDQAFDSYDRWCRFNNLCPLSSPPFWKEMCNHFGATLQVIQRTVGDKRPRLVNLFI
ncbi:MAG: phage/plasmid primase, P4 family [Betaproteobacteria bacterium]